MVQERKQLNWRWAWIGAAIILVLVFMSVRSLTRERLQVRAVQAAHKSLESTISTNGRVEPVINYEVPSPISTTVKAVYVQPGDTVPAGKLIVVLDDVQARARLATAQSAVKAAEAARRSRHPQWHPGAAAGHRRRTHPRSHRPRPGAARSGCSHQAQCHRRGLSQRSRRGQAAAGHGQRRTRGFANEFARAATLRPRWPGRKAALDDAEANLAAARQVEDKTKVYAPAAGTVYDLEVKPTAVRRGGQTPVSACRPAPRSCAGLFRRAGNRQPVGRPADRNQVGRAGRAASGMGTSSACRSR